MPTLTISIGSNLDAEVNLRRAMARLHDVFGELRASPVYESEAVGFAGNNFLNLVVAVESELPLAGILDLLHGIEDELGRDRSAPKFANRAMDLDVLTYGDEDGSSASIKLPRPEITRHAFVLQPMAELFPSMILPGTGQTLAQLWESFDKSSQRLWPVDFEW